jgi:hypothetical protein
MDIMLDYLDTVKVAWAQSQALWSLGRVLGEKNLSHLRGFGILVGDATQRLRTGLISAAPPALRAQRTG